MGAARRGTRRESWWVPDWGVPFRSWTNLLRSFVRPLAIAAVPLAFATALPLGACDDASSALTSAGSNTPVEGTPKAPGPTTSFSEGGTIKADVKHGLCGAAGECSPDNDGSDPSDHCATSADAGVPVDGYEGCHVVKVDSTVVPRCQQADPRGVDGTTCANSADCAPGFDCVEGEKGPICRRYCCSGSCESQLSRNGGSTFCDIGKLASVDPYMIPVCMPLKACKLLAQSDCGDAETCAVVTEKGVTSCVPRGDAKVGDSCDESHCDANLNCLGNPGDRHCYKLCHVAATDCGPMETCTTGSVFQDTTFGVCRTD